MKTALFILVFSSFASLAHAGCERVADIDRPAGSPAGHYEVFAEPYPFDTQFDVYAMTKTSDGYFFHVRPSSRAAQVKALEGDHFVPQRTDYQKMKGFFDFFGFKESCEASVGCFFSQFPNASEFEARKKVWNARAIAEGHPERVIELTYLGGGEAPKQRGMARNMVAHNGATHMQDPRQVYAERYIPIGAGKADKDAYTRLEVDPTTGRVKVANSLGRHDLQELTGSLFVPRPVLDHYVRQADAYRKLLSVLDKSSLRVVGSDVDEFKNLYRGLMDSETGKPLVPDAEDGITAARYMELLLYHAVAAQHADFHMGHWLAGHSEGIDPTNLPDFGWGSVFQREVPTHLIRAGVRAPEWKPSQNFPLAADGHKRADPSGKPLTLELMLQHSVNESNRQFVQGFERIYASAKLQQGSSNPTTRAEATRLVRALDQLRATHPIFQQKPLSPDELAALAEMYRAKMRSISSFTPQQPQVSPTQARTP